MGTSTSHQYSKSNISELFPKIESFKPLSTTNNDSSNFSETIYIHTQTEQTAIIKNLQIRNNKRNVVEQYYEARAKINNYPHIFELIDTKTVVERINREKREVSNNLCNLKPETPNVLESSSLWLFTETSCIWLEDEILNRVNKRSFEEIELWSVLSSSVLGALNLLEKGFKEPVLSPKGIGLSKEGIIKVGEWELVSNLTQNYFTEEGEVIFSKFGQPISETSRNPLNELLINFYWAPEGLKAMENFISLGQKEPQTQRVHKKEQKKEQKTSKFQVFSLGMTLISMCLRNCYYKAETYSEKYLLKLIHQTTEIRKVEGKELSPEMGYLIKSMVKWDPEDRISYEELKELIIQYFNNHQEMKYSSISIKTFDYSRNPSQSSNTSMNLTEEQSFADIHIYSGEEILNVKKNSKKDISCSSKSPYRHICSTGSAFDSYEGSGMVEQGTGDDDDNLQVEKEQSAKDEQNKLVTQRSQKSEVMSKSIIKEHNSENICFTETPNMNNSPLSVKVTKTSNNKSDGKFKRCSFIKNKNKENLDMVVNINPKNEVYLTKQDSEDEVSIPKLIQREKVKTEPSHFEKSQEAFVFREDNSNNSVSSGRGSYRSTNKEPPKISIVNEQNDKFNNLDIPLREIPITSNTLNSNKPVPNKEFKHKLVIECVNGNPDYAKSLGEDEEDESHEIIEYSYFFDIHEEEGIEFENPDVFESFEAMSEISNDEKINAMRYLHEESGDEGYEKSQRRTKRENDLDGKENEFEYATFNQTKSLEEGFNKINIENIKPSIWKDELKEINEEKENLFTDPKILDYIREPFVKSKQNSFNQTSRFKPLDVHTEDSKGKENLAINTNSFTHQQGYEKHSVDMKSEFSQHSSGNISFDKKECLRGNKDINNSKMVREKVSKGFYEGEKKNGMRSGYGVFYYNEGGKYKGNWLNNQMHGKGTLEYADGRVAFQGDWHRDELHGKGVLYNQSPNFVNDGLNYENLDELDECWILYEGEFENDDKSGMGLLLLSNHEQFAGEFKSDMADGVGEYVCVDGTVIRGVWEKNKLIRKINY